MLSTHYSPHSSVQPPSSSVTKASVETSDLYPKVPAELKGMSRWVAWKREKRGSKATKVPYNPATNVRADTTDASTWVDYATAHNAHNNYDGIGCVIAPPYVGVDLDGCRNPDTGELEQWAKNIIDELNSYSEVSPSGTGVHIWLRGTLPKGRRRAGRVEMYDAGRYFSVTGDHLTGTPLDIDARDLTALQARIAQLDPLNRKPSELQKPCTGQVSAESRFEALMAGQWQGLYHSQSDADAALCAFLKQKHGNDGRKIDQEFRRSKLMRPKWDEMRGDGTYGQTTIDFVLNGSGAAPNGPVDWRAAFKSYDEMEKGEFQFLIDRLIPHGVTFIGGLSGVGKTWFALSAAKAIVTGHSFLQNFPVPSPAPVLYMIPESGERAFRVRLETMRLDKISGESFLCRTMNSGPALALDSPEVLAAARALNPVVVLDTVQRFSTAEDENSAAQNKALASAAFGLLNAGARGVLAIHHSPKSSARESEMSLENALRGTGDLGAMADAVYGLKCQDPENLIIQVSCVKFRDSDRVLPFRIQGRPYLSKLGDFVMLGDWERDATESEKVRAAINNDPTASSRDIEQATGIDKNRVATVALGVGLAKADGRWGPVHVQ